MFHAFHSCFRKRLLPSTLMASLAAQSCFTVAGDSAYFRVLATCSSHLESLGANGQLVWSTEDNKASCTVLGTTNLVASEWQPVAFAHADNGTASALVPMERVRDLWKDTRQHERTIPAPLPGHPGNVFLAGDEVAIPFPSGLFPSVTNWMASDESGAQVAVGVATDDVLRAGALAIGWLRFDFMSQTGSVAWTTAAVLAPLQPPTPQDSPFCMDAALAGFAYGDTNLTESYARLAALAGVNWIRDRGSWTETAPAPGVFAPTGNRFEVAAELQAADGLKMLQVQHDIPPWATNAALDGGARNCFPRDLRDAYRYFQHVSFRFAGHVLAWEPWNEAEIEPFGGHLMDERCAFQKAAFLGLKAGNTNITIGWNPSADGGHELDVEGLLRNEAWPYFDTYNIHSYAHPEAYDRIFEPASRAACGKPVWMTECGIYSTALPDDPNHELSASNQMRQAAFFARSFASALHAGVNRYFAFLLPNYHEAWNNSQYGLLRPDLTPRPAYVACAAIGRLLAGARPLGRHIPAAPSPLRVYAFRAFPDGIERDVLVCWATNTTAWELPPSVAPNAFYDYLGRALPGCPAQLDERTVFVLLPAGESSKWSLEAPREQTFQYRGDPSPVVMQLEMPRALNRLDSKAHELTAPSNLAVHVYNFSGGAVSGTVRVAYTPEGWVESGLAWPIQLDRMQRQTIQAPLTMPDTGREAAFGGWVKLQGDFGANGEPVLAFRLINQLPNVQPSSVIHVNSATNAVAWHSNIAAGGSLDISDGATGVVFAAQFAAQGDAWAYPYLDLVPAERPDASCDGLVFDLDITQGGRDFLVLLQEENGSIYACGVWRGGPSGVNAALLFAWAHAAAWAAPDDNNQLDPDKIVRLYIGLNSEPSQRVQWKVQNIRWARWTPAPMARTDLYVSPDATMPGPDRTTSNAPASSGISPTTPLFK